MSGIASIEVFRNVLDIADADFYGKVTTMSRLLTDQQGSQIVTMRTDNKARPTINPQTVVYPELRYTHLRAAGLNVRHLYKKTHGLRETMEEGGKGAKPLQEVFDDIADRNYNAAGGVLFYTVTMDEVDIITQPTRRGDRRFVVIRSKNRNSHLGDTGMLGDMSEAAQQFLEEYGSDRLQDLVIGRVSDSVPVAKIESSDCTNAKMLADHIGELLPVDISFDREIQIASS